MIDEELKQKAQRLALERAEKSAALENAKQEVELSLNQLDAQIEELADMQKKLIADKQELLALLGRPDPLKQRKRQAPGTLIKAYTEALKTSPQGMTSTEVVAWLKKNRPELKTVSIPAVLSRGLDDGRLQKDDQGRFTLAW